MVGSRIGTYEVLAKVGEGGMGEVYRARDRKLGRDCDRYRVTPDGRRVVYIDGDLGQQQFYLMDLATGARRALTNLQPGFSIRGFDLSRDAKSVVFDRIRENADLVLIER